jgi:hypothetical protein
VLDLGCKYGVYIGPNGQHASDQVPGVLYIRPSAEHVSDQVQGVHCTLDLVQSMFQTRCRVYIRPSGEHVFRIGAGRTLDLVQSMFQTRCRTKNET